MAKKRSVRVALKASAGESGSGVESVIVEGELSGEIKEEEVMWHIESGRFLTLTVEKKKNTWFASRCLLLSNAVATTTITTSATTTHRCCHHHLARFPRTSFVAFSHLRSPLAAF